MRAALLILALMPAACGRVQHMAASPELSPIAGTPEQAAMLTPPMPASARRTGPTGAASLWAGDSSSLLGDRRAMEAGDILTVVIEIDERAEIQNSSQRSREASEQLGVPSLFGLPDVISDMLPGSGTLDSAVGFDSASSSSGDGTTARNETLELRIAGVVTSVQPNGVLAIWGSQEVRVNNELRELLVTGYVRPEDITRQNEITYDKIASARISYGGRGAIADAQRPRPGQRVLDRTLPF
jgi:flagellar L-ring protein precursor FlgH